MPPLTNPRHETFAQNVAAGKTLTEAVLIAGYSVKTAATNTTRLTKNDEISQRIRELQEAIAASVLVDASKLHRRWSEMFDADIGDIIDVNLRGFKPIHEWPKIWRQMLQGVDMKELFEHSKDGGGASWDKIGEVIKIKFVEQLKLGELIGKHKAVDAFVAQKPEEHLHLHLHEEIDRRIASGRERLRERTIAHEHSSK